MCDDAEQGDIKEEVTEAAYDLGGKIEDIKLYNKEDFKERLKELVCRVKVTPEKEQQMVELCGSIETILHAEFPDVVVRPFGSSACGLALRGCDLDVSVELGEPGLDRKARTMALARVLRRFQRFRDADMIIDCRTPIVQVTDQRTGIKCDVSACSSMGCYNTKYVKFCLGFDQRARSLAVVIKCFARRHGITGCGLGDHLTSYGLVLMVIHFLQACDILHPLGVLQEVPELEEVVLNDYNFSFCTDPARLPPLPANGSDVVELLLGFFRFYGRFPFHRLAVSLGRAGPTAQRKLGMCATMVVQDPFELGRNVAGAVSRERLAGLGTAFRTAATLLEVMLTEGDVEELGTMFVMLFEPGFASFYTRHPAAQPVPAAPVKQPYILQPAGRPGRE